MCNGLSGNAPFIHPPDQGGGCPYGTINQQANSLNNYRIEFIAAFFNERGNNRIKIAITSCQRNQNRDDCSDSYSDRCPDECIQQYFLFHKNSPHIPSNCLILDIYRLET